MLAMTSKTRLLTTINEKSLKTTDRHGNTENTDVEIQETREREKDPIKLRFLREIE